MANSNKSDNDEDLITKKKSNNTNKEGIAECLSKEELFKVFAKQPSPSKPTVMQLPITPRIEQKQDIKQEQNSKQELDNISKILQAKFSQKTSSPSTKSLNNNPSKTLPPQPKSTSQSKQQGPNNNKPKGPNPSNKQR